MEALESAMQNTINLFNIKLKTIKISYKLFFYVEKWMHVIVIMSDFPRDTLLHVKAYVMVFPNLFSQ